MDATEHTFEFTWTQLHRILHDGMSMHQCVNIFNSCDAVTITLKNTWNDEKKEYALNRGKSVVDDLRSQRLPNGMLKFGGERINDEETCRDLGIEDGAVLIFEPMTKIEVVKKIDSIAQTLEFADGGDSDEDSDEEDYDIVNEYYGLKWTSREEYGKVEFVLDFSRMNITIWRDGCQLFHTDPVYANLLIFTRQSFYLKFSASNKMRAQWPFSPRVSHAPDMVMRPFSHPRHLARSCVIAFVPR